MNSKTRKWRMLFAVCMLIVACFFVCYETNAENEEVGDAFANEFSLKVKEPEGGYFSDIFVNDFADILSPDTISEMTTKADEFYEKTGGISVVVTTLPSLEDGLVEWSEDFDPTTITTEDLATIMYNQYGIGKHSMGILVLLSMEEGDIRLEPGINMEGYLPDSICNRIVEEYGMPYFYEEEFDEGMISLQSAIISEIKKRVPNDWIKEYVTETEAEKGVSKADNNTVTNEESTGTNETEENKNFFGGLIKMIVIILLLAIVAILIVACYQLYKTLKTCEKALENEKEKYFSLMNLHKRDIDELKERTEDMNKELNKAISEKNKVNLERNALKRALTELRNKYAQARSLHPELEDEIADMIEKEWKKQASELDEKIKPCLDLPADKDNIESFRKAIKIYEAATADVKKYVTSDMERLHSLCEESESLLRDFEAAEKRRIDEETAERVFNEIVAVFSKYPTGTHVNYEYLKSAYEKYDRLTRIQKAMIPNQTTISDLKIELERAREDYNDYTVSKKLQEDVRCIIDRIYGTADEDDLEELEEAYIRYSRLTSNQREYFNGDLYHKMMRLKNEAEADHERKERERRQREAEMHRPPMHYSDSPSHRPSSPHHEQPKSHYDSPLSHSSPSSNRQSSTTAPKKPSSPSKPSSAPKKADSTSKSTSNSSRTRDNGRAGGGGVTKNFRKKS